MKISPNPLTINQLFATMNEQYFIPAYQRRYAWQWKQAKELFDDILFLKNDDSHLLGNIVCLAPQYTAGINALEVVDGQQRLTTLSLLLKAFQDLFEVEGNEDEVINIRRMLKSRGANGDTSNKVLLGELDNDDYQKVLAQRNLNEANNENLVHCYANFYSWLQELSTEERYNLYVKLLSSVSVIRLDVHQAKDAYKLFETINNRGLSLNHTDIIKNFLFGHASKFDQETLNELKENWKGLIIALDNIDTDDFFRQWMCSILKKKVTFTYLIDEFKRYYINTVEDVEELPEYRVYKKIVIKDEEELEDELDQEETDDDQVENIDKGEEKETLSIIEFSEMLEENAKIYARIRNREYDDERINDGIYDLQRIQTFPGYIFLLRLFQHDEVTKNDILKILKYMAVFMLRRHTCEYRTGELDEIFAKLIKKLDETEITKAVQEGLKKDTPGDEEFKRKFKTKSYKSKANRAKYVMEQFEYRILGNTGEIKINSGREVHLEHIIPQTINTKKSKREYGDWESYLGEDALSLHPDYVNLIGNFTLLGQKLNIVASNNPFEDKLEEYQKSALNLTKNIVDDYKEFKFSQVQSRSEKLADIAPQIWKL